MNEENSSINDPIGDWLSSGFGACRHLILSVGFALVTGLLVIVLCDWCIVPCLIASTMSKMLSSDVTVQIVKEPTESAPSLRS